MTKAVGVKGVAGDVRLPDPGLDRPWLVVAQVGVHHRQDPEAEGIGQGNRPIFIIVTSWKGTVRY